VVRQIDPRVPILDAVSLAQANERWILPQNLLARAAALLGLIALVLAAWGLYAVVSYVVTLRSREIAVRLALGAKPRRMLTMVLAQAMTMAVTGGIVGGAASVAIWRIIRSEVHVAHGIGVAALSASGIVLALAMLVAALVPAVHASRVDPMSLLKEN
jgi:ABC-type antimicrobial peptide transport system permease subunit